MDPNKLHTTSDTLGFLGFTFSTEQWNILANSLTILQSDNHFKNIYFWGIIYGQEADYLITYGYEKDALFGRKFFYRYLK